MSYWSRKGKYQKAYDFLYNKLVPSQGAARSGYGEMIRVMSRVIYRYYNDGDTYDDLLYDHYDVQTKSLLFRDNKRMPEKERNIVESMLSRRDKYDSIMDYILVRTMLHLSTKDKIFNPDTNRLVAFASPKGMAALKKLDCQISHSCQEDAGDDESIITKFGRAIVYNPGSKKSKKKIDTFDYKTYCSYINNLLLKKYDINYLTTYENVLNDKLELVKLLIKTAKSLDNAQVIVENLKQLSPLYRNIVSLKKNVNKNEDMLYSMQDDKKSEKIKTENKQLEKSIDDLKENFNKHVRKAADVCKNLK